MQSTKIQFIYLFTTHLSLLVAHKVIFLAPVLQESLLPKLASKEGLERRLEVISLEDASCSMHPDQMRILPLADWSMLR